MSTPPPIDHAAEASPATPPVAPAPPPAAPPIQWTADQLRAIEVRDGDVVVSASAGSGKTAVLSERVVRLVADPDSVTGEPAARIEELLIITFTEKATRQMRERIERDLRKRLAALEATRGPEDGSREEDLLRAALDGLPEAWIMTIDAFCRRVVMEHFHLLGLSPAATVPDAIELADHERRLVRELIERRLATPGQRAALEELLFSGGLEALVEQIRALLDFLQSLDEPDAWRSAAQGQLQATLAATRYEELPEARQAAEPFARATRELADALESVIDRARALGGDGEILRAWTAIAAELPQLAAGALHRPDAWAGWLAGPGTALLKMANKGECGAALYANKTFTERIAKPFSSRVERWRKRWLAQPEAVLLRGAQLAATRGLTLLELATAAETAIAQLKQRRGWTTFADFERNALRLLTAPQPTPGAEAQPPAVALPSAVAAAYREQFRYVLVDEYQDTSPLQHALIRRVSRDDPGQPGNLFIVGDVKQSIYRFRHAEPALFMQQIAQARGGLAPNGQPMHEVRLRENFRSRPALLGLVNHFFRHLMDPAVGEIDYDRDEALLPGRTDEDVASTTADPLAVELVWLPRAASEEDAAGDTDEPDDAAASDTPIEEAPSGSPADAEERLPLAGIAAQAAWVAARIRAWCGESHGLWLPDEEQPASPGQPHPRRLARPGDCAILLRSMRAELEAWLQALRREGLNVRAPGLNPLFTSPELIDLMLALRAADNPLEDLTLAALMRSPLFSFSDDELLRIRLAGPRGVPYHEAVWAAAGRTLSTAPAQAHAPQAPQAAERPLPPDLLTKLAALLDCLDRWRATARSRPIDVLLNTILHDTAYEAWLMAHADAPTRLEHVDFLRGLIRRFGHTEAGSDALTHFLELVERARLQTADLGDLPESVVDAGAAVNLLTIHKSKGLEFPIVFLPRLERAFHGGRKGDDLVFDLAGGLALDGIDARARRRYPTLARQTLAALRERKERSEELRLLYVAMTRARERLVLLGQLRNPEAQLAAWASAPPDEGRPLPAFERLGARAPADLLGPLGEWLATHADSAASFRRSLAELPHAATDAAASFAGLRRALAEPDGQVAPDLLGEELEALRQRHALPPSSPASPASPVLSALSAPPRLLPAHDPQQPLTLLQGKTSVTALRQARLLSQERAALSSAAASAGGAVTGGTVTGGATHPAFAGDLPRDAAEEQRRFLEELLRPPRGSASGLASLAPRFAALAHDPPAAAAATRLAGNVLGSLTHRLLELVDLRGPLDTEALRQQAARLAASGSLGPEFTTGKGLGAIDYEALAWFFETAPGREMRERPGAVERELKFTARKPVGDFLPGAGGQWPGEFVLVQGIIDVVIDRGQTALVIDYKTDRLHGAGRVEELVERYRDQVTQYGAALQRAWSLKSVVPMLVLLGPRQVVDLPL